MEGLIAAQLTLSVIARTPAHSSARAFIVLGQMMLSEEGHCGSSWDMVRAELPQSADLDGGLLA